MGSKDKISQKITYVLYSGLGGHASVVFSMLETGQSNRYQNKLIFYGIEPLLEEYESKCNELDVEYTYISKKPGLDFRSIQKFYQSLKTFGPSVIFLHSTVLIIPSYFYSLFRKTVLIAIEHTPNVSKSLKDWVVTFFSSFLSSFHIMLTSEYYDEVKKKLKFIRKGKTRIISNGIDTNKYTPAMTRDENGLKIGMVSRFTKSKDHATLIKALKSASEEMNTIQLHLAGDGDTENEIKEMVSAYSMDSVVSFYGRLDEHELIPFFQNLDIYIHSTHGEAMSTSMMQAYATGLPVIATKVKGVENLVKRGGGILVNENDPEHLSEELIRLGKNKDLRLEMGKQSRSFAEKELTNQVMFDAYFSLI